MSKPVATFGEIMLRLAPPGFERFLQSPLFSATFGGGEANVAVSVANYGIPAAFVTVLPPLAVGEPVTRAENLALAVLLIDEFENGMHHTVQLDVWRGIFRLAKLLNVQVFATSHSWDAIEAFQKASIEDPEEGLLIRLSRKADAVISTLFREDELAVATRDKIEVR